jgi:hypothetical protein
MDTPRPPRPATLQPYIRNLQICAPKGLPHASESAKPRPMENISLSYRRKQKEQHCEILSRDAPHALWIVFWRDQYNVDLGEGMRVPPPHLWWLADGGDEVLLSDRVTHHYTTIGDVDRERQRIQFLDPWPENFFLQEGRNILGIASKNSAITRKEFEQTVVGILTWDSKNLLDSYFSTFPDAETAEQRHRAGEALMAGSDYLCTFAVKHFCRAMQLADESGDETAALQAAAHACLAGECAKVCARFANEPFSVAMLTQMLEIPVRRAGNVDLLTKLDKFELARLAHSFGKVHDYRMVEIATARALEQDPHFEDAYRLRAIARCKTNPRAAIADAKQALALNMSASTVIEAELARLGPRHPIAEGPTDSKLYTRHLYRADLFEILAEACEKSGDATGARDALREFVKLTPRSVNALRRLLQFEVHLENTKGAVAVAETLLLEPAAEAIHASVREILKDLRRQRRSSGA